MLNADLQLVRHFTDYGLAQWRLGDETDLGRGSCRLRTRLVS